MGIPRDWLGSYRESYQRHLEREKPASLQRASSRRRMVQAGEWPPPSLLQRILDAGDAAVEPLHDVLRALPQEWPGMDSLSHAIGLLGMLRRPESVTELARIAEEYDNEPGEDAAGRLAISGRPASTRSSIFARTRRSRAISEPLPWKPPRMRPVTIPLDV